MADTNETGDYSDVVSRRKFVSLAGTTGAAAVAGCVGDDGDDGDGGDDGGGDDNGGGDDDGSMTEGTVPESSGAWFDTAQTEHDVESYHYNFNQFAGTTHVEFGLHAQYAKYDWTSDEFQSHLVEEWDIGATEATFTIRDDFTWSNGEDLTAEDLVVQWQAYETGGHALWEFADSVDAPDSTTLRFQYPEGTNDNIVKHAVLHENASMPPEQWEDYVGSDEAITEVTVDEPISSGPLVLDDTTENYHQYVPRDDDHPFAGNYNWEGYRMRRRQGNQDVYNSFQDQELDGLHSLYAGGNALQSFPDTIEEITIPGVFGMAVWFNHDRDPWSTQEVRQALAYSVDLETVLFAAGSDTKIHHPVQTGLTAAAAETWFGGFNPGGFNSYEQDTDMATSLLQDAGFEGPGDIESELIVPSGWSDWVLMAGNITDQLGGAGWGITLQPLGGAYWSARPGGDFDLLCMEHSGSAQHNEPYFSLRTKLVAEGGNFPDNANYEPDEDVSSMFESLATTQDEDEQTQLITDLAEIVNKDLPYLHVAQKYEQSFIDREFWEFPEDTDSIHFNDQWPLWNLPKTDEQLGDYRDDLDIQDESSGLLKANENAE